jgi:opacity protein-like surface antigen
MKTWISLRLRGRTFGSEAWFARIGLQWRFADRWAVRAEYQRVGDMKRSPTSGDIELENLTLGFTFAF